MQLRAQPATADTFSSDAERHEVSDSEEEPGPAASDGLRKQAKPEEDGDAEALGLDAAEDGEQRRYPLRVRTHQEPLPLQPTRHSRCIS